MVWGLQLEHRHVGADLRTELDGPGADRFAKVEGVHRASADRIGSPNRRHRTGTIARAPKGFRRIMGHEHLRMLKAALDEPARDRSLVQQAAA